MSATIESFSGISVEPSNDIFDIFSQKKPSPKLEELLINLGFINFELYDWRETDHSMFDDHSQAYIPHMDKINGTLISLNVECRKK